MGNMARDRCRCSWGSLIFAILAFDLLASSVAVSSDAGEFASSRNYYKTFNDDIQELEHELELQLHSSRSNFHTLDRRRRVAVEPHPAEPVTEAQPQKPSGGQNPVISTKSKSSVTVSYSTSEHNTTADESLDVSTTTAATVSTSAPDMVGSPQPGTAAAAAAPAGAPAGKGVIVSTPIVPSNNNAAKQPVFNSSLAGFSSYTPSNKTKDDKPKVKVWANQTMWSNATDGKKPIQSNHEGDNVDDFSIDKYPAEVTNKTFQDNNITKSLNDTHQYYNSSFYVDEEIGKKHWVDLDNDPKLHVNPLLSRSHRRASTIKLSFDFPFYGHKVRNITIATGGFLYTGEYVHSWLAATQYIAPLMANFDTTLSPDSYVKYADSGSSFTVEWEKVHLQDKPEAGAFTFQVTLKKNGDIIFVYAAIPVLVENIEDREHPVKIGLSDAYMMDRTVFFARRKTIYEYHRVNFSRQDIKNWTVIYLKALPTCLQVDNCNDCLTKIKDFDCKWCPELQMCSTGTFRFRQEWLQRGCDIRNVKEESKCPARTTAYHEHVDTRAEDHHAGDMPEMTKYTPNQQAIGPASSSLENSHNNMNMGVSGIIGILFVVSLIAGLGAWAAYAYRNPHSASGQMLIRYRPSQWSWRRGEARYTAATIHM